LTQQAFQGSTPKSEATQSTSLSHPKVLVTLLICLDQPRKQLLVNLGNKHMTVESGSSLACRVGGNGMGIAYVARINTLFDVDQYYSKRNEAATGRAQEGKKGRCGVVLIYTVAIAATYASKSHCSKFLEIKKHGM
jgi:hypothetical protein